MTAGNEVGFYGVVDRDDTLIVMFPAYVISHPSW